MCICWGLWAKSFFVILGGTFPPDPPATSTGGYPLTPSNIVHSWAGSYLFPPGVVLVVTHAPVVDVFPPGGPSGISSSK